MANEPKITKIEEGTAFDGAIQSLRPLRISGDMEGKLEAPEVNVTKSGALRGEIKVGRITSEGEIGGRIEADEVHLAGKVMDGTVIEAGELRVDLGVGGQREATFGTCELRIGSDVAGKKLGTEEVKADVSVPVDQRDAQPDTEEEPVF